MPCSLSKSLECTDRKLARMSTKPAVTATCIYRRVLSHLLNADQVSVFSLIELLGLTADAAQAVVSRLARDQVVASESSSQEMAVNKEILTQRSFPAYLGIKKFVTTSPAITKNDQSNPVGGDVENIGGLELKVKESVPSSAGAAGDVCSIQRGDRKGKRKLVTVSDDVSTSVVIDRGLDEEGSSVYRRYNHDK